MDDLNSARQRILDDLIARLIAVGMAQSWTDIAGLVGAGDHQKVLRYSSDIRTHRIGYLQTLEHSQIHAFAKALAAYEDTVGGLGSVTTLSVVIPLLGEGENATLDWILSETNSYVHYSKGAKSAWGMRAAQAGHAASRAASLALEKEREGVAKLRKAGLATERLPNAVRRGDLLAVKALLAKGADRTQKTPEGLDLAAYALGLGHQAIHDELMRVGEPDLSTMWSR